MRTTIPIALLLLAACEAPEREPYLDSSDGAIELASEFPGPGGSTGTVPGGSGSGGAAGGSVVDDTDQDADDLESDPGGEDEQGDGSVSLDDTVADSEGEHASEDATGDSQDESDGGGTTGGETPMETSGDCLLDYGAGHCWHTPHEVHDCETPSEDDPEALCNYQRCIARFGFERNYSRPVPECFDILCPSDAAAWLDAARCMESATRAGHRELLECYDRTDCSEWAVECRAHGNDSEAAVIEQARAIASCARR